MLKRFVVDLHYSFLVGISGLFHSISKRGNVELHYAFLCSIMETFYGRTIFDLYNPVTLKNVTAFNIHELMMPNELKDESTLTMWLLNN